MKVLQINSVCGRGSTGRIATDLADILRAHGEDCRIAYGRETVLEHYRDIAVRIGNDWDVRWHGMETRLFDAHGFGSRKATERFLVWVREYDPDVIHLHNIHGYYINIELLFEFLKMAEKPVIWTLHDCWAFTGHCAYFTMAKCAQWKGRCAYCVQKNRYPQCILWSSVNRNFDRKRMAFQGVQDMTLIAPSEWLAELTKESFLNEYPVRVIPNGIDLTVFHPTKGNFRERYGIQNKKILLGVANVWDERKGLNDFVSLSSMLGYDFQIVLVGLSKRQKRELPDEIIGIMRTSNPLELAEIYTAANVFVNPTYEDNFPTTNLEALACGTPVVTYRTGGSPESVDESCGIVVEQSVEALAEAVKKTDFPEETCLRRARLFDKNMQFEKYMRLYENLRG